MSFCIFWGLCSDHVSFELVARWPGEWAFPDQLPGGTGGWIWRTRSWELKFQWGFAILGEVGGNGWAKRSKAGFKEMYEMFKWRYDPGMINSGLLVVSHDSNSFFYRSATTKPGWFKLDLPVSAREGGGSTLSPTRGEPSLKLHRDPWALLKLVQGPRWGPEGGLREMQTRGDTCYNMFLGRLQEMITDAYFIVSWGAGEAVKGRVLGPWWLQFLSGWKQHGMIELLYIEFLTFHNTYTYETWDNSLSLCIYKAIRFLYYDIDIDTVYHLNDILCIDKYLLYNWWLI